MINNAMRRKVIQKVNFYPWQPKLGDLFIIFLESTICLVPLSNLNWCSCQFTSFKGINSDETLVRTSK